MFSVVQNYTYKIGKCTDIGASNETDIKVWTVKTMDVILHSSSMS